MKSSYFWINLQSAMSSSLQKLTLKSTNYNCHRVQRLRAPLSGEDEKSASMSLCRCARDAAWGPPLKHEKWGEEKGHPQEFPFLNLPQYLGGLIIGKMGEGMKLNFTFFWKWSVKEFGPRGILRPSVKCFPCHWGAEKQAALRTSNLNVRVWSIPFIYWMLKNRILKR